MRTRRHCGASLGDDLALQADGKTVATQYVGFKVVRFNTNGSLDATFGTGGRSDSAASGQSSALAIQPDGYIVVGGFALTLNNGADIALARLDPAGHVDATFGAGGSVTTTVSANYDSITAIALQADGKIVVGGLADQPANPAFLLARYDSGGTLDPSFGSGGIVITTTALISTRSTTFAIQPDGAIVAVGLTAGSSVPTWWWCATRATATSTRRSAPRALPSRRFRRSRAKPTALPYRPTVRSS
jgi:uncharacterized delta-60 repeat protein